MEGHRERRLYSDSVKVRLLDGATEVGRGLRNLGGMCRWSVDWRPRLVVGEAGGRFVFYPRRTTGLNEKRKRRDEVLQAYALPGGGNGIRCSGARALVRNSTYAVLMSVVCIQRCSPQTFWRKQLAGC